MTEKIHYYSDSSNSAWDEAACGISGYHKGATRTLHKGIKTTIIHDEVTCKRCRRTKDFMDNER